MMIERRWKDIKVSFTIPLPKRWHRRKLPTRSLGIQPDRAANPPRDPSSEGLISGGGDSAAPDERSPE